MSPEQSPFDPQRCTLTVPNDLAYLPMIQGFVRAFAAEAGFPAREVGRFDLLMEEVATNVIHGAFAEDERATFDISCERVPAGVQITVHDEGLPFDPSLIPEYDPSADLHAQTGRGLGSFLMQKMADTVEFHNLGSRGKETVFIRYLETRAVTDAPPAEEPAEAEAERVPAAERAEIGVGPLVADQAIEVCRCIYDAYRYTYVNEHMYYPDRVVALNESGDMVSAVASTADGEVAGHAALVFPEDSHEVADMAVAAVKAKFRGQSIARRLGVWLEDEARARGLHGLFIEEVTVHTYTQKFSHRLGFTDTGFLLAYSPATTRFEGIAGASEARRSVIVGFKYLTPPGPAVIYAPGKHKDVIAGIYERLGAPVTFGRVVKAAQHGLPELHVTVNTKRSVATIRIPTYGRDLAGRIRAEVVRLLRESVSVINVFLDLSARGTGRVADALEDVGFIFSGVLPGGPSGDWLIMQFFNGVVVDYDSIQVEQPTTADLLAYIRANDPLAR